MPPVTAQSATEASPAGRAPAPAPGNAVPGSTIAADIGAWVSVLAVDDVPSAVTDYAKLLIADTIGVGLAGLSTPAGMSARSSIADLDAGRGGPATVIGTTQRLSTRDAAMVNGIVMDVLGMDDTHLGGACHISAVILPTVLAVGQQRSASGQDVLSAYLAGVEVEARVGAAAQMGFLSKGFSTSTVAGCFGAAVAAGHLLGLTAQELTRAQGFVGGLAAGSMQFGGSGAWTKSVNKGWPAVCGITAAHFARNGYLSPHDIYEGRLGTFANYTPTGYETDPQRSARDLGTNWETLNVISKRYPVCHFIDSALQAVTRLRLEHDIDPANVVRIECLVPEGAVATICDPEAALRRPVSGFAASSSLYFNVALALHHGTVTIESQQNHLQDPSVLRTGDTVTYQVLADTRFPEVFESDIKLVMRDGTEHRRREASAALSPTDFEAKFTEQTAEALGAGGSRRAWETLMNLDTIPNINQLFDQLLP